MKTPKNLVEEKTTKPQRQPRSKTWKMKEVEVDIFEAPKELEEFQRPQVIKLNEIGDFCHGYYEGLQPVEYKKTGGIGYLLLLRQGKKSTDKLFAINAGYDIRRWLSESGFDSLLGEYLKVTLDNFVDTSGGSLAPMKQYRFGYTQDVGKQLQSGSKQTLAMLEAKQDGIKLLKAKSEKVETWEEKD
jgi:hypothetical protein